MNRYSTLLGFIKKELVQTLRDRRMRSLLFIAPLMQLALFGYALSSEVKNIRLAVVFNNPSDQVLRDIYERSIASRWFVPATGRERDPYQMIVANEADAVLVPPPGGFTKQLGRGDARLQLLINATNVLKAQAIESYLQNIIQRTVQHDLHLASPPLPIRFHIRVLYNPAMDSALFMIPGVIGMLLLMMTMVMTLTAIVREKELGTFEMLISAPVSRSAVIYGKTIPYLILGIADLPLSIAAARIIFHVPMRGSYLELFAASLAFASTAVALGVLISTYCRSQQQALLAGMFFIFPLMMFSGFLFPVENMPAAVQWLPVLDPIYHFMGLLNNIMLEGGGTLYVIKHTAILFLMAIVSVLASFHRFHTTLQ